MGNAWNELADYYQQPDNNPNGDILIGSIDCTNSPTGKALCAKFKIMGLPTILYGDTTFGGVYLEEYRGDKSFSDFKQQSLIGAAGISIGSMIDDVMIGNGVYQEH